MTSSELSKEEAGTLYVVGGFYQVRGKQILTHLNVLIESRPELLFL